MAGDWIKVEKATLNKSEVLRMAELLGITRRECVGLLLDFWAWLDSNSRTENVPNLSRVCLDSVLNCPGFSSALVAVGWVEWNDSASVARIVNYDHHNGTSAKTRAYEQKKKKIQRENVSRFCPANSGPEKRREEKSNTTTSAPTEKISFDAERGWLNVSDTDRSSWREAYPAISVDLELAKAKAWVIGNPKNRKSDWRRFLVGWLTRAQDRAPPLRSVAKGPKLW